MLTFLVCAWHKVHKHMHKVTHAHRHTHTYARTQQAAILHALSVYVKPGRFRIQEVLPEAFLYHQQQRQARLSVLVQGATAL